METEINLVYLLKEFKRNLKAIIIGAVICALLFAAWGYKNYKGTVLNYGAESKIVAEYSSEIATAEQNGKYVAKDHGEAAQAVVSSDDVLNAAIAECDNKMTLDELRGNLYVNTGSYGDVITVIVTNTNQEKAIVLCNSITKNSVTALNSYGVITKITQLTKPLGSISIDQKENTSYPYRSVYKVSSSTAISIKDIAKRSIIGLVFGIILMYFVYCVSYLAKGLIVYPEEVEDMGLQLMGLIREKEAGLSMESACSKIVLKDEKKRIAILELGADIDLTQLQELCKLRNVELTVSKDVLKNPFERTIARKADIVIIAIKKGSIKRKELIEELGFINKEKTCTGVLFVD